MSSMGLRRVERDTLLPESADSEKLGPCGKDLTEEQMILCDLCLTWYHGKCVSLSEEELEHLGTKIDEEWVCQKCFSNNTCTDDEMITCPRCPPSRSQKKYKGMKGLRIHYGRAHRENINDFSKQLEESLTHRISKYKRQVKVLKRIPKGARMVVAHRLSTLMEQCCSKNDVTSWENLLVFPYTVLRVPTEKAKNLSQAIKKNVRTNEVIKTMPPTLSRKTDLSRRVESKISEGDRRGAVKILSSSDTLAKENDETYNMLLEKHPAPSRTLNFPEPPLTTESCLAVSEAEVQKAVFNFPNGSAGGVDGIRPQHLKDLISKSNGIAAKTLLSSLTRLVNFMLRGVVNGEVLKILYGASLCALNKKGGGIRPIAVGNTYRRLAAKLACQSVNDEMGVYFNPKQLGFGTKGGCEAIVHAARTFIKHKDGTENVILKVDFQNAFNCIERDSLLAAVKEKVPTLYPFLNQCYSTSSTLFFGERQIQSQVGAQQGDPAGCLVFSLVLQPIIEQLTAQLNMWYLDDGTLGGDSESVYNDFCLLMDKCKECGLQVNPGKCELFFCGDVDANVKRKFEDVSPGIKILADRKLSLLGAPVTSEALKEILSAKFDELLLLFQRLKLLKSHIAYHLLRHCFYIPKLNYILRTTPTWILKHDLEEMDDKLKECLEEIINVHLNEDQWKISSLPVLYGGIGIRKITDISVPAFLASVNSVLDLVQSMLTHSPDLTEIANYSDALEEWNAQHAELGAPPEASQSSQHIWDTYACKQIVNDVSNNSEYQNVLLKASCKKESNGWLNALPSRCIGTLLDNNSFRIAISLRLGLNVCIPHTCICGAQVNEKGTHGLSCKKSAGRHSRHFCLNDIIRRALISAQFPSVLEPTGINRDDNKRPDGMTLVPWRNGQALVWDATCTDTLAAFNLSSSAKEAGTAAQNAASKKKSKYRSIIDDHYNFVPFAVETLGPWCEEAMELVDTLGRLIAAKTGEGRSKAYLMQRISIAIQKGNAACVMGTLPSSLSLAEIFYLL